MVFSNPVQKFIKEHGEVPPPWEEFPGSHPFSMGFRMGAGEAHIMYFAEWWKVQGPKWGIEDRIEYFERWPPPPRWMAWMLDVVWGLSPEEEAFDYSPYFEELKGRGFPSQAQYEKDLDDPKWLEAP